FYLLFMPSGACLSLDAWRAKAKATPSAGARIALRTLQLHLCAIYLSTGIVKARGEQWQSGEAIWRAMMQPQFHTIDVTVLAQHPALAQFACWGVLLVECGYAVAIWIPRLRRPWLLATLLLHAGIGISMRLWIFSLTMALFNIVAFGMKET